LKIHIYEGSKHTQTNAMHTTCNLCRDRHTLGNTGSSGPWGQEEL
jgi:hypothetical protein